MTTSALASPLVAGAAPVGLRGVARAAGMSFPASMRDLLSRRPFSKTVRLHAVFVEPTPVLTTTTPRTIANSLTTQLLRMRQVYAGADIGVDLVARDSWSDDASGALTDLDVGVGRTGASPQPCDDTMTAAQTQLFAHRDGMADTDVAIYLVRSIVPAFNGCGAHPPDEPGAAVADIASPWTLAHEVGHVLGLVHADSGSPPCLFTRLMTGCGTGGITGVPTLSPGEVDAMRGSPFLIDTPR